MSTSPSASTRRGLRAPLAGAPASGAVPIANASDSVSEQRAAIRPFRVEYPESDLLEMRRRIAATRWPEKETVSGTSQGVPLAALQDLARYWAVDYDWRKCEARLNALPQFTTEIDGLDIHFIHVRSQHEGALPVIVTHGWPGSILEQIKLIGPHTLRALVNLARLQKPTLGEVVLARLEARARQCT
jgi:hypothetical protein